MKTPNLEHVIIAKAKDLGDNFIVRRALPYHKKRMVGPFIFWDHMGPTTLQPDKPMTVRAHPHIGLATITYLFSGQVLHRDSLNNEQYIKPGEVNWMTAGRGIAHSERAFSDQAMDLEGIQLWVALPLEHEDAEASFYHAKEKDLPMIEQDGASLRLIAGSAYGQKSPVPVYSDLFYLNGKVKGGQNYKYDLPANHEGAVYVVGGKIEAEGETYEKFALLTFEHGTEISFTACEDCEVMIFGGKMFPEGRHIWWNFVSSSKEKIEKAKTNWKNRNFDPVINETEFIPLPED